MRRASRLVPAALVVLALVAAGCGDDEGDDTADTTTTEASSTSTDEGSTDTEATEPDATDPEATSEPEATSDPDVSTTSPNLTPNGSPLGELLLDPSEVGEGYAPDDSLGDGRFDGDLCEDVTVADTSDDQASQALSTGADQDSVSFTQSVMRFADDAAAEEFVTTLAEGISECTPDVTVTELDDVGSGSLILVTTDATLSGGGVLVRVGDLVSWMTSGAPTVDDLPLTEELAALVAQDLSA